MGNINKTPQKADNRKQLRVIGWTTVKEHIGKPERIARNGKPTLRQVTKGDKRFKVSVRTSQDGWIGFQRNRQNNGFTTLEEADWVVVSSVDDPQEPALAQVHIISGDEIRERFDRAYSARIAAGHRIPKGQPMFVSLYEQERTEPVSLVGAGAGLANAPVARVPLQDGNREDVARSQPEPNVSHTAFSFDKIIGEAKRKLALTLGVDPSRIKIIVEM